MSSSGGSEKQYKRVLTIAGSDSGGGAGIQADLKTISANGCYGLSVITALTAQNTVGVTGIFPVPVSFVEQQLETVLSDIGADAVKIGMLFSPELIIAVARQLEKFQIKNIILDPVMIAQSGDKLLQADAVSALRKYLVPMAKVVTPNLPEASVLLDRNIDQLDELHQAAKDICQFGCSSVLIKGGHLEGKDSDDCLYICDTDQIHYFPAKRITTQNNHGTGCTLSSAIASNIAQGLDVANAVQAAKEYITGAIGAGADYVIGKGHGPVHHFYRFFK